VTVYKLHTRHSPQPGSVPTADGTLTSTKGESEGTWRIETKDGTASVLIEWPIAKAWDRLPLPLDPKGATGTSSAGPGYKVEAVKVKKD
jgi:hypothetical protein